MQTPHSYRKGIPFFYDKSASEFSRDRYERYDDLVKRQIFIHLTSQLSNAYHAQGILNFVIRNLSLPSGAKVVELGCSVGRLIGSLASVHSEVDFWGLDYSYQLVKAANDFWVQGKDVLVDTTDRGFEARMIQGQTLKNLQFGLAMAEALPFEDQTQDVVLSSFLLERLQNPVIALEEMYRVLKIGGQMIMITPLNFTEAIHWRELYPVDKIRFQLMRIGFDIVKYNDQIMVKEPLDVHGNAIMWKCIGLVCRKLK
ncbi:MAG: class I SAM-dependent methyltransferase [Saprospiraceae bacterium]|nr:class I SAM-dependent methyltransferase [Saprospiraceae bacterium]